MAKQRLEQKQYQNLSPQQIQFLGLLQTPIISLEKRIEEELEENPALDEDEEIQEETNPNYTPSSKLRTEEFQIEDKSESLQDYLLKQLIGLNLKEETLFLVKYLINSLDDNGFLSRDLYSISSDLLINTGEAISENQLENALKILQELEPTGVASKDLKDCLLLQLEKLHSLEKIAFQIISEYYSPFSNKNYELLIKQLNISKIELKRVYKLVEGLNPIPAAGFSKNSTHGNYVYADFTITLGNNTLELNLNKGNSKKIKVSQYYSDLLLETTDLKTKEFLKQKIEKAKWFKESIEKRESTLKRVMLAIMEIQRPYLISGIESDLKPMKLADIADIVSMDISTISRVSNSKYLETHFGTFKIKELFSDAYRKDNGELISTKEIKRHLEKIISTEDKLAPFTDEKLAEILGKDEYHIARRTVAKYREQLGIKPAKLRRNL